MSTLTMPQQLSPLGLNLPNPNGIGDEDKLYEIVNGEHVELPPMSILAVSINTLLGLYLGSFVVPRKLGRIISEGMFILDSNKKLQRRPDLAFVSTLTWPLDRPLPSVGDWQVVPELAVEVISPNDFFEDVLKKVMEYFAVGVKNVWVVSPGTTTLFVFHSPSKVSLLGRDDELDGGDVVPGFRLKLAELFASI